MHTGQRGFGDSLLAAGATIGLHLAGQIDKPLVGQHRLNHCAGTVAARHHQLVRLDFTKQAQLIEVMHNHITRFIPIQATVFLRAVFIDARILGQHANHRQVVALSNRIVIEIMRRGNLHAASAEGHIDVIVGNNRNDPSHQRQGNRLANQMLVTLIFRIHRHGGIAQHGFRAGGGHGQMPGTIAQRIVEMPHRAIFFFADDLQIRHRRVQHRIPVDQALAAINQAVIKEAHEGFLDRIRQPFVHSKALA